MFVVAILSAFFCFMYLPDLVRAFGYPLGDWGFTTVGDTGYVAQVTPGGPAARAGMKPGQHIDLSANTAVDRSTVIGAFARHPGTTLRVAIIEGTTAREIVLRAARDPARNAPLIMIRETIWFLPFAFGALLLLRRPSPTTWGFFLFTVAAGGIPPDAVAPTRILPESLFFPFVLVLRILNTILPRAGLVLFAFSLSRQPLRGWRIAAVIFGGALGLIELIPRFVTGSLYAFSPPLTYTCQIGAALVGVAALLDSYQRVTPRLKQRLHWIAVGLALWVTVSITDTLLWPAYESYQFHTAIDVTQLLFPLIVAYALLRERVVDINFVISRTVAYGAMTAIVVGVFALIDLFLSKGIAKSRFSLPVDIVVALVLGFFFHGMRNRVDFAIDRILFRKRHVAEMRLARAAKAIVHVEDPAAIGEYLVELPAEVLDLTGAALYLRSGSEYRLRQYIRWEHAPTERISCSDRLAAFLSSELAPVRLKDVPLRDTGADKHDSPVVAMPLVFRRELAGFVLYGAHENGADLDADEEQSLLPLVANAAVTYDHLEAQALRDENDRLRTLQTVRA